MGVNREQSNVHRLFTLTNGLEDIFWPLGAFALWVIRYFLPTTCMRCNASCVQHRMLYSYILLCSTYAVPPCTTHFHFGFWNLLLERWLQKKWNLDGLHKMNKGMHWKLRKIKYAPRFWFFGFISYFLVPISICASWNFNTRISSMRWTKFVFNNILDFLENVYPSFISYNWLIIYYSFLLWDNYYYSMH